MDKNPNVNLSDHDLLIALNENVAFMRTDLSSMRVQIGGQIADHEARLRVGEADREQMHGSLNAMRGMFLVINTLLLLIQVAIVFIFDMHK